MGFRYGQAVFILVSKRRTSTYFPTVAVISLPVGPTHRMSGGGDKSSVTSSIKQVRIIPESTFFT